MTPYPVRYHAVKPARFSAVQLGLRLLFFVLLGTLGLSFGLLFIVLYLALPGYAAARVHSEGPERYLQQDAPRVLRALEWVAVVCAWAGLVVDRFPHQRPEELVTLRVTVEGASPSPGSALVRVFTGLPSALLLAVLGCVGAVVWLWAALSVLFVHRVGPQAHAFLEGLQRWSLRLLVYQASLVDAYPPTTLQDGPSASGFKSEPHRQSR